MLTVPVLPLNRCSPAGPSAGYRPCRNDGLPWRNCGQNALLDKLDAFRHLTLDGTARVWVVKNLTPILLRVLKTPRKLSAGRRTPEITTRHVVVIREGSAARNLNALAPLINELTARNACSVPMTVTRGKSPIRTHRCLNSPPDRTTQCTAALAYRVASWSTARHFGLNHLGYWHPASRPISSC